MGTRAAPAAAAAGGRARGQGWSWGRRWPGGACLLLWGALAWPGGVPAVEAAGAPPPEPQADAHRAPEAASGRGRLSVATASRHMIVTAHPLATQAGLKILREGGSAVDAAIAAQLVLGLVEPQSSGLGGGGFLLHYQADEDRLRAYDGREAAPAAARPDRFLRDGRAMPFAQAMNSGLSVGVPGLPGLLALAHARHGRLAWPALFEPALALAEAGFEVTPRLHILLKAEPALRAQPAAAAYFYDAAGEPWPVGHRLRNPALADTLRRLAREGASAFYEGDIARDIVAAVRAHARPGDLTLADLAAYRAVEREPLCRPYRHYRACGMPPPSAGGVGVLQLLGLLEALPLGGLAPDSLEAVHYFAEAGRLAYADRDRYLADPAHVEVPVAALLAPDYLRRRAALVRPDRSLQQAEAGDVYAPPAGESRRPPAEAPSTTHLTVADGAGNVVSLTSSIESAFGSKLMLRGFLLNNQLTDFDRDPVGQDGRPAANRVEAGKRPRSSMSPTIVFEAGRPRLALGSPGGSAIINYVARAVSAVLDGGLDVAQAVALPHAGSRNGATELERGTDAVALAPGLRALGHPLRLLDFTSGLHAIEWRQGVMTGAADPRREGRAAGD